MGIILSSQSHLWTNGHFFICIWLKMSTSELSFFCSSRIIILKITIKKSFLDISIYSLFRCAPQPYALLRNGRRDGGILTWSPVKPSLAKWPWSCPYTCTYHPFECSEFLLFPCHLFDAETFEEPCIVVSLCKIVYQHPVPSELVDFFLPPSPHSLGYSLTVFNINLREAIAVF